MGFAAGFDVLQELGGLKGGIPWEGHGRSPVKGVFTTLVLALTAAFRVQKLRSCAQASTWKTEREGLVNSISI